jgi:hypothetical protein
MRIGKALKSPGFHKWATIGWATVGSAISMAFPQSVPWVGFMSLWANVVGHWSSFQAALAEEAGDSTPHVCRHCGKDMR